MNAKTFTLLDFILNDDDKHAPVPNEYVSDENEHLPRRQNENISPANIYGKKAIRFMQRSRNENFK